jgi:hypothetical protein
MIAQTAKDGGFDLGAGGVVDVGHVLPPVAGLGAIRRGAIRRALGSGARRALSIR